MCVCVCWGGGGVEEGAAYPHQIRCQKDHTHPNIIFGKGNKGAFTMTIFLAID